MFLIVAILAPPYICVDDAIITARYALNWVNGHGLVSRPGDPRVEGFSNPTLILATALFAKIMGVQTIWNCMKSMLVINLIAAGLTLWLISRWGLREKRSYWWLPALALIIFPPFFLETKNGMETALYMFFLTALVMCLTRRFYRTAVICAIALSWSRPEGVIISGLIWLSALVPIVRQSGWACYRRWSLMILLGILSLFAWRVMYFHQGIITSIYDLFPITVQAKSHTGNIWNTATFGLAYLWQGLILSPILGLLLLFTGRRIIREKSWIEAVAISAQLAFITGVGGDLHYFGPYRFLMPIFPFLFRSISLDWIELKKPALRRAVCGLCLLTAFTPFRHNDQPEIKIGWCDQIEWLLYEPVETIVWFLYYPLGTQQHPELFIGEALTELVKPEYRATVTVTCNQAGAFATTCPGKFIDIFGLVSPEYSSLPFGPEKEAYWLKHPTDILVNFARKDKQGNTSDYHFVRTEGLTKLGYFPVCQIQIRYCDINIRKKFIGSDIVYFLCFIRDPAIIDFDKLREKTKYQVWTNHDDETGVIKKVVPVIEFLE